MPRSSVINPVEEWSALDPRLLRARGQVSGEPLRLPKRLLEARRVFDALAEGGAVQMPLDETFWSLAFGVVVDRFGVPWRINCEGTPEAA